MKIFSQESPKSLKHEKCGTAIVACKAPCIKAVNKKEKIGDKVRASSSMTRFPQFVEKKDDEGSKRTKRNFPQEEVAY